MPRQWEAGLLVGLLLVTGAVSWWLMLRPVSDPDPTRFDALPTRIGQWQSVDIEMQQSVTEMLAADHNVQRAYRHPQHYVVFVYIGYYGTLRGGTPEHTPDVCYPSQGWEVAESNEQRIGGQGGFDLKEFVVERDGVQRLVHFWYRTSRASGIVSVRLLRLHLFWERLTRNRGDGALVRLSTAVPDGDVEAARSRLLSMDRAVQEALQRLWGEGGEVESVESARYLGRPRKPSVRFARG